MKVAVYNIYGVQTTRDGQISFYSAVTNSFNFSGNSATDVTSVDNLTFCNQVNRIDYIDYRDSLNSLYVASGFTAFTSSEQQTLSQHLIPTKIERETIYSTAQIAQFASLSQIKYNDAFNNRLLSTQGQNYSLVTSSNLTFSSSTIIGSLSAATLSAGTLYSGSTNLYQIFAPLGGEVVAISNGTNTYTGGTATNPSVNVSALTINTLVATGNTQLSTTTATSFSGGTISGGTFISGGTNLYSIFLPLTRASLQSNPADPATTTSTTGVMMGLAGTITPRVTGNFFIIINGDTDNSTNVRGTIIQIRTGTGTAPTNGAALIGTARGSSINSLGASTTNRLPFSTSVLITGAAVGTAMWIDISLAVNGASGTARVRNINIVAIEI